MSGEGRRSIDPVILALLFALAGALVFETVTSIFPVRYRWWILVTVILISLASALTFVRTASLRPHSRLAVAYLAAACGLLASGAVGDWSVAASGYALKTTQGFTALKLGEDVTIVGVIVAVALLTQERLPELYLTRGRIGLGMAIGIPGFLLLTALGLTSPVIQNASANRVQELLPAFLLISLADGFTEELLFRGLFLKKFARYLGDNLANVVTATVFAFAHLTTSHPTAALPVFLTLVFLMGLLMGWLMQKTGSLLAPALLHAGVDMLVISDVLGVGS